MHLKWSICLSTLLIISLCGLAHMEVLGPPRVKFFLWLACQDRCWPQRGWLTEVCNTTPGVCYSPMLPLHGDNWAHSHWLPFLMGHVAQGSLFGQVDLSHPSRWGQVCGLMAINHPLCPTAAHNVTSLLILVMAWWIWKQRNTVIFNDAQPDNSTMLETIKAEAWL